MYIKSKIKKIIEFLLPSVNRAYFVAFHGRSEGPYSLRYIESQIKKDEIKEDTLLWVKGAKDWVKASTLFPKKFS